MKQFTATDGRVWNFPDSEKHFQEILDINPEYQFKMKEKLIRFARKFNFTSVIDIGANVGLWTRWFKYIGASHIDCFEPMPENIECLKENTKDLTGITIHEKALGDCNGDLTLYTTAENKNSGTATMFSVGALTVPHIVPCVTLDSLKLNPTFIKMDIQGGEMVALQGAVNTIRRCHPGIIIECEQDTKPIEFLEALGYSVVTYTTSDYLMRYGTFS